MAAVQRKESSQLHTFTLHRKSLHMRHTHAGQPRLPGSRVCTTPHASCNPDAAPCRWPELPRLVALAADALRCVCDVKDVGGDAYYRLNADKVCMLVHACVEAKARMGTWVHGNVGKGAMLQVAGLYLMLQDPCGTSLGPARTAVQRIPPT